MNDARGRYAPLTNAERTTDGVPHPIDHRACELVSPIPADAPPPPNRHPRLGQPTARWTYRDAEGAPLFHVYRFDPPGERKQFNPLTLRRDAKGLRWRWKGVPEPRPLWYGLDRLTARPDAPVILCEGEKSADAAARIFPDHIAVTSAGGAKAAATSDWTPLEGRHVRIWPDCDKTGQEYAHEVAPMLTTQGCTVSMIAVEALSRIDPVSGEATREVPDGWDAADAIDEPIESDRRSWTDLATLREAALKLAKPAEVSAAAKPPTSIAEIKTAAASLHKDDIAGAKQLIETALNAKASEVESAQIIRALAKSLGVAKAAVESLWGDIKSAVRIADAPTDMDRLALRAAEQRESEAKRAELYERCEHIAINPNLLDHMANVVARLGVVNERSAIKASYLTATSRLEVKGAIALLRRGAAASGKNFLVDAVSRLIPPESVVTAAGGSPMSLAYYGGVNAVDALKHKIIYISEAAAIADKHGVESPFTTMLRVLISEGRIVYQTVQTQENGPPITVTIIKNGPIAVFITSARDNIEEEMLTRLMVLDADESDGQTRAIIESSLSESGHEVPAEEIEAWIDFQRWLELDGPYDVVIPFLPAIRAAHDGSKKPPRYRRDLTGFLTAIKASAIVYVAQRKRDERGRVVAELSDYAAAHEAFDHDMASLYSANVPETAKAVVRAVEGMIEVEKAKGEDVNDAKVTYDGLASALGIDSNDTAGRRLKEAQRLGLIELIEPPGGLGRTTPRRYRVLVTSSDLQVRKTGGVFPTPAAVREAFDRVNCTDYTGYTGRIEAPSPPLSPIGSLETDPPTRLRRGTL